MSHSATALPSLYVYESLEKLKTLCSSFVGKTVQLTVVFDKKSIPISNSNLVGDLLEDVFLPSYREVCPDIERGPPQQFPDFYVDKKKFHFEQKAFNKTPGFDLANFDSFVDQISKPGGLNERLFKTKYLIYEYAVHEGVFVVKHFWMLNLWNMPSYDNKYPISIQVKRNMWYNIRPGPVSGWDDKSKTPAKFIANLLECIRRCEQIKNKAEIIASIEKQMGEAKIQGFL